MLRRPEDYFRLALGVALLVLLLKALAYEAGGGAGLLSDAAESLVNALTAILGLYGTLLAHQPRDPEHPYGHGKVDSLLSGLQALLIAGTAGFLAYAILHGNFRPLAVEGFYQAYLYEAAAIALNASLSFTFWRAAKRFHSQLLKAESLHLLGDGLTSLLVVAGLGAVQLGLPPVIDKGIGLVLVSFMGYGAFQLLRETGQTLLDAQDPRLLARLVEILQKHRRPEWIDIHNVRIQRYGVSLHIDGHITFPWYWSLQEAHTALKGVEELLRRELHRPVEFFWHMDPCEPSCCAYCLIAECPHRQRPFEQEIPFTPEKLFLNQKGLPQETRRR